jgi:hypothetical protein
MPVFENYLSYSYLLFLPLLVALYFFKTKPKKEKVSSHFLWQQTLLQKSNNSFLDKFKNHALLWAQAFFFLALFLALGNPSIKNKTTSSCAILIDNSGSTSAKDQYPSRLEYAKKIAYDWAREKGAARIKLAAANQSIIESPEEQTPLRLIQNIEQSYLPDAPFSLIYQWLKNMKQKQFNVLYITDQLNNTQLQQLKREGIHCYLTAKANMNSWISSVKATKLTSTTLFQITVKTTSSRCNGYLHARSSESSETITSIKLNWQEKTFHHEFFYQDSTAVKFSIQMSPADWIDADNFWNYIPRDKKPVAGFSRNFPDELKNHLKLLLDPQRFNFKDEIDPCFLKLYYLQTPPDQYEEHSFYILKEQKSHLEFLQSALSSKTSGYTKFMTGNSLNPAMWAVNTTSMNHMALAISSNGKAVPVLSSPVTHPSSILFNLSQPTILSNPDIAIFLENYIRSIPEHKFNSETNKLSHSDSIHLAQKGLPGLSRYLIKQNENIEQFIPFPEQESGLLPATGQGYPYTLSEVDSGDTVTENKNISYFFGLAALFILMLEWILFIKQS